MFETRLGCLQEEVPQETLRFIAAVNDMMTLSDLVMLLPRWSRSILPFWKRFVQAWDDLYGVGRRRQQKRLRCGFSLCFSHRCVCVCVCSFSSGADRQESG